MNVQRNASCCCYCLTVAIIVQLLYRRQFLPLFLSPLMVCSLETLSQYFCFGLRSVKFYPNLSATLKNSVNFYFFSLKIEKFGNIILKYLGGISPWSGAVEGLLERENACICSPQGTARLHRHLRSPSPLFASG